AGRQVTSLHASCPTSAINRSLVALSKLIRHGLRTPYAQISPRAPVVCTNGLSDGTYGAAISTSSLSIFPSSTPRFCALLGVSPAPPPSPTPAYSFPSGPNAMLPPL